MSRYFDDYYFSLPNEVRRDFYEETDNFEEDQIWKEIKWAPGYYVSVYGDVMSVAKGKPHILATWRSNHGHRYLRLYGRTVSIHRLVAEAFIYNRENYPIVRHLNDDPEDNYVDNLAWGTQYDNRMDCVRNGNEFRKSVYCYETDTVFRSCADAAEYFGVNRSLITMCCEGKVHSISGNHLCYLNDLEEKRKDPDKWFRKVGNYKRVKAINKETGETMIFNSRKEASEYLNIPDSGISSVISGRISNTHGWIFENLEE